MFHYSNIRLFSILLLLTFAASSFYISASSIDLSNQEKSFLLTKKNINMCVATDFMPHEDIVDGKYVGMVSEYVGILSKNLGVDFILVPTESWQETVDSLKNHRCDIIPLISQTPERSLFMNFTEPYYIEPLVIATKDDKPFVIDIEDIISKPLGIVRGYAYVEILRSSYSNSNIVEVDSVADGLEKLHDGEIYAYLGALNVIGYHIQKSSYREIKINGTLEKDLSLSIGSRNDMPLLVSILNKAVNSISDAEKKEIKNSWVKVRYERQIDYTTIVLATLIAILIFLFVLYHNLILRKHNRSLERLSETDKLTGLNNRLKLDRFLQFHIDLFERHHEVFSVILIDIDHFKNFNDQFGHLIGDKVLSHVASLLKANCRKLDMVGRWGGEEFLMICPKTNLEEANVLAESLRSKVESSYLENIKGVTVSLGIAQMKISYNINTIISSADKALFLAKKNGRNRIEVSE